ncbi:hypothetical protein VTI28DRAFT_1374 [Corynascus sepedonium]
MNSWTKNYHHRYRAVCLLLALLRRRLRHSEQPPSFYLPYRFLRLCQLTKVPNTRVPALEIFSDPGRQPKPGPRENSWEATSRSLCFGVQKIFAPPKTSTNSLHLPPPPSTSLLILRYHLLISFEHGIEFLYGFATHSCLRRVAF